MQSMASCFPNHFMSEVLNGGGGFVIREILHKCISGFHFLLRLHRQENEPLLFVICSLVVILLKYLSIRKVRAALKDISQKQLKMHKNTFF